MRGGLLSFLLLPGFVFAQPPAAGYTMATLAGTEAADVPALDDIQGVAADAGGNVYFSQPSRHRIYLVNRAGVVTVVAGLGQPGFGGDGGRAANALLQAPYGLAVDRTGNLFIADLQNGRVRRVSGDGTIRTVAGGGTAAIPAGGIAATLARLHSPRNLAFDSAGNLYVSDFGGHRVLRMDTDGVLTAFAGTGQAGMAGETVAALAGTLGYPAGLAIDGNGVVYVADSGNNTIRRIAGGMLATLPLPAAMLHLPAGLALDAGGLYISNAGSDVLVRLRADGTAVGMGRAGRDVALDGSGNLLLAAGSAIRRLSGSGRMTTVASAGRQYRGDGGPASEALLELPQDVKRDGTTLLVADSRNHAIRRIVPGGLIQTIAGDGEPGFSGDNGPALEARLSGPQGLARDGAGNVFIADTENHRIRRIGPDGRIVTVAGSGTAGFNGDGAVGVAVQLSFPTAVAVEPAGSLLIADTGNQRVRRLLSNGAVVTIAGSGERGFGGDGGQAQRARFDNPTGLAAAADGSIFIADTGNSRVRRIGPQGTVSTLAGPEAGLQSPAGVALGPGGALFVSEMGGHRIRRLAADGTMEVVAGTGVRGFSGDGGPAVAAQLAQPAGMDADADGTLWVADRLNHRIRRLTVAASAAPGANPPGSSPGETLEELRPVHAATLQAGAVAPGMLVSLQRAGIGPAVPYAGTVSGGGALETALGGVQVLVDGRAAPLLYAQSNLINLQVPYRVAGQSSVPLEVVRDGRSRLRAAVPVVAQQPGIFTSGAGSGQVAAIHEDLSLNSASNPAPRGSIVVFYATGEGMPDPPQQEGRLAEAPYPRPAQPLQVLVGGVAAEIASAGSNVTSPGVLQIAIRVPQQAAAGAVPLLLQGNGVASQPGVVLHVR